MKRAILDAYRRLPEPVRYGLRPLNGLEELASFLPSRPRIALQGLAEGGRSLVSARHYRAEVALVRGVSSVDGAPLAVVTDLAGEAYVHWVGVLFADSPVRDVVGEVRGPLGFTRVAVPEADLVLFRHNRLTRGRARAAGFATVPAWVQSFLDTRRPLAAIIEGGRSGRSSRKNDVRRTLRADLQPSITRGPAEVRHFFTDWYLPFTAQRWGATGVPLGMDWARQAARYCEVMWVSRAGERVGAALLEGQGRVLRCVAFGVRDAAEARGGAIAACYYFMIERAVQQGYHLMRLGGCRPILSDGALRHKAKWGGVLMPVRQWDYVAVKVGRDSAAARALLQAHPLVAEENGRFLALAAGEPVGVHAGLGLAGLLVPDAGQWIARPLAVSDDLAA